VVEAESRGIQSPCRYRTWISPTSIQFGYGGARTASNFAQRVFTEDTAKKTIISLSCETGRSTFAKEFSEIPTCGHLIAPFHSVHGAVASQFFQTYMCWHLLYGKSTMIAFKKAAETVPGKDIFRLWRNGEHDA